MKNVLVTMIEKAKIFVLEAGRVILVISLILWALSTWRASLKMEAVEARYEQLAAQQPDNAAEIEEEKRTALLETLCGYPGKAIEPVISPLLRLKIGIALITSFAAREVFVGTMATIYSVGQR